MEAFYISIPVSEYVTKGGYTACFTPIRRFRRTIQLRAKNWQNDIFGYDPSFKNSGGSE